MAKRSSGSGYRPGPHGTGRPMTAPARAIKPGSRNSIPKTPARRLDVVKLARDYPRGK
jgi:hypothetical protein